MRWTIVAAALAVGAGTPGFAAETVAAPQAVVRGHTVTHAATGLTIRVPKSAHYVGSDRFDLYGMADAEIQLFAESDRNKRLTKLYWIQFESYWPDRPELKHDYTGDRREQHWGTTVWVRAGVSDTAKPSSRAGSDGEHMRALLKRAGYTAPAALANVRLVQLLDDPKGTGHGRRELMFIYGEDLARSGKTLSEVTTNGEPNANFAPIEKALVERGVKAFSVERR
jgi:hypothetical protein